MSEIQQITDYNEILSLLMEQYKRKENFKGIIKSMNSQADDLETALFEIRDLFWLDTAEGVQLDTIGKIIGVEREGQTDTDYRNAIKIRASLITSGEPESIIAVLKNLFDATYVYYIPSYPVIPAGFYIISDAVIELSQLTKFVPSGVQPYLGNYIIFEDGDYLILEDGGRVFLVS